MKVPALPTMNLQERDQSTRSMLADSAGEPPNKALRNMSRRHGARIP